MKLSKVMVAIATLAAGASAFAAPLAAEIAISAGASASRLNMIAGLQAMCTAAGGTPTSLGSGNFRSVVCANSTVTEGAAGTYVSKPSAQFVKFNGTNFVELRFNTEGSFSAVLILNGATPQVRDPAAAAASSTYPAGSVNVGGLLDVNPNNFPPTTIGANTLFDATTTGFAQTFGVAVSSLLYSAMFTDQQTAGLIPAAPTCTVASTNLSYCVPSISKGQMATIMANNTTNPAYVKGARFLAPTTPPANTELRYVRRVNTSGTQAAAQNYFLGLNCSTSALAVVLEPILAAVSPEVLKNKKTTNMRVMAAPGTGDVIIELNKLTTYGIGIVSGENNPTSGTINWKWLRVDGAAMAENATPGPTVQTNTATQIAGTYDFYYESVYMGGSPAGDAFWSTVTAAINALPATPGLVEAAVLAAGYTKSGDTCVPSASN